MEQRLHDELRRETAKYPDVFQNADGSTNDWAYQTLYSQVRNNTDQNARLDGLVKGFADGAGQFQQTRKDLVAQRQQAANRGQGTGQGMATHEPVPAPDFSKATSQKDAFDIAHGNMLKEIEAMELADDSSR